MRIGHLWRRRVGLAAVVGLVLAGLLSPSVLAARAEASSPCTHPVLILSAMPLELSPILAKMTPKSPQTVQVDGRRFYLGQLAGTDVVLAMTGIGPANAQQTAAAAFKHFSCGFSATIFSGVAGSQRNIGDVTVPARWTMDQRHWIRADAAMVATAATLSSRDVALAQTVPVGDPACLCTGVDTPTPVRMPQPAQIYVGGDGATSDPFGGQAIPCVPGGGDIAGCEPCISLTYVPGDAAGLLASAPPLLADLNFWPALLKPPAQTTSSMDAQDEETAAVGEVAARYRVSFLGIRAVSDGKNDPLHLPGFPAQFFVYRQLAANNGAAVTIAFLRTWAARGRPT